MNEITITYNGCGPLESIRHEILAEDIIKQVRASFDSFGSEMRKFIRESMVRGFDRSMVKHSITVFMEELVNIIHLAENSLTYSNSPKAKILENELMALKYSLAMFAARSEAAILEVPVVENQLIFERSGGKK